MGSERDRAKAERRSDTENGRERTSAQDVCVAPLSSPCPRILEDGVKRRSERIALREIVQRGTKSIFVLRVLHGYIQVYIRIPSGVRM